MKNHNQANRGMSFETLIEHANLQYAAKGMATIQKVATPWKVIRGARGQITDAFPEKKSTVDFIGAASGVPIAFDAKSTQNKTRFPMSNIEEHQYRFLLDWNERAGGKSFLLIEFSSLREIYLLDVSQIAEWWLEYKGDGRSSIPLWFFQKYCSLVKQGRGVVLDYLPHVIGAIGRETA